MIWPALSQIRRSDGALQAGSPGQVSLVARTPAARTVSGSTVTVTLTSGVNGAAFDRGPVANPGVPKSGTRFGRILD